MVPSVLLLQRILPPYRVPVFTELAKSHHFSFTIAYGNPSPSSALESVHGIPGIDVRPLGNLFFGKNERMILQSGVNQLIDSGQFNTLIAEFNPRIVTNILAMIRAKKNGMKVIWWGHGLRPKTSRFAIPIYNWLARKSDALIFYSAKGQADFVSLGIPVSKTFVAWNTIDSSDISRLRRDTPQPGRFRVINVGRLIRDKKTDLTLRAYARAYPRLPEETRLTIIGDGPERAGLQALAAQLGIDAVVEFTGSVYDEPSLARYFNSAWATVSSGYVGLSAIHSLAYGVPMLVADNEPHSPEIEAVDEGVNADYFAAGNEDDLADKLTTFGNDLEKRSRYSTAALSAISEKYNISVMAQAFEDAIDYANRELNSNAYDSKVRRIA